jgi:hypothetical protein
MTGAGYLNGLMSLLKVYLIIPGSYLGTASSLIAADPFTANL